MNPGETAINPFTGPSFLNFSGEITPAGIEWVLPVIFTVVFALWLAYTLVVAYHWLRYGRFSLIAVPMLAVHIVVSGTLILLATSGIR